MQKPLKYTQTTGVAAAVGITSLIDASLVASGAAIVGVDFLVIQTESQPCRWTDDGVVVPTAAVGHLLQPGQTLIVYRGQFATFSIIQVAATAKLNVTAYKGDAFAILPPGAAGTVAFDQTTPGTTDSVSVKSAGYTSQPTVTRPANTTPYTAGDVVGGAIEFTTAGPSGGHVLITDADLTIGITAVPSGMTSFRLHLYDVTPPSALADNAPWTHPSGDRASYLGYIDIGTPALLVAGAGQLFVQLGAVNKKVKLAAASTSLFGYLVTNGGFTPAANSEVYLPRLQTLGV